MEQLHELEEKLDRYLRENKKDTAIQLLYDSIVSSAGEKNFVQAEALREKLYEVDPLAIKEIVATGEIIEAEKSDAIDKDHLNVWADFYSHLTPEETNCLFYGMQAVDYADKHMVFKQGQICSQIYFIDEGQLKMFYRTADKTILLKTLGSGDIIGEDTFFFSDAFCTTTVITDSAVKMRLLDKDTLALLNEKSPGLEAKIIDYCGKLESVRDLLQAKKLERRVSKRITIPGKVLAKVLNDNDGEPEMTFRGELLDISTSGLAFIIKTTEMSASLILGREIKMELTFAELESDTEIITAGTAVAVNKEPFNEYILHIDFSKNLNRFVIDDLEDLAYPK